MYVRIDDSLAMSLLRQLPEVAVSDGYLQVSSRAGTLVLESTGGGNIYYSYMPNNVEFGSEQDEGRITPMMRNRISELATHILGTYGGSISSGREVRSPPMSPRSPRGSFSFVDLVPRAREIGQVPPLPVRPVEDGRVGANTTTGTGTGLMMGMGTIGGRNFGGTFGLAQGASDTPFGLGTDLRGETFRGLELEGGLGPEDEQPGGRYDGTFGGARYERPRRSGG